MEIVRKCNQYLFRLPLRKRLTGRWALSRSLMLVSWTTEVSLPLLMAPSWHPPWRDLSCAPLRSWPASSGRPNHCRAARKETWQRAVAWLSQTPLVSRCWPRDLPCLSSLTPRRLPNGKRPELIWKTLSPWSIGTYHTILNDSQFWVVIDCYLQNNDLKLPFLFETRCLRKPLTLSLNWACC